MDEHLFAMRVAPLLPLQEMRALRCASRAWRTTVDQLLPLQPAFVCPLGAPQQNLQSIRYLILYGRPDLQDRNHLPHLNPLRRSFVATARICLCGTLADAKWFVHHLLQQINFRNFCRSVVDNAVLTMVDCLPLTSSVEVAAWLCDQIPIPRPIPAKTAAVKRSQEDHPAELMCKNVIFKCCVNGHLAVTQYLIDRYQITYSQMAATDHYAFRAACEFGHLQLAQYLACRFPQISSANVRVFSNYALSLCSRNGHFAVAEWLIDRFHLTKPDAHVAFDLAERSTTRPDIAAWLSDLFGFKLKSGNLHVATANFDPRRVCSFYSKV
jgi:ankyrin repeat protein